MKKASSSLNKVAKFLDEQHNQFVKQVYPKTGYPVGHELREIVKGLGGSWNLMCEGGYYDTLRIPYENGTIVVERPTISAKGIDKPHRVNYEGKKLVSEDSVIDYLTNLHQKERAKSKEWYLNFHGKEDGAKELADKLF